MSRYLVNDNVYIKDSNHIKSQNIHELVSVVFLFLDSSFQEMTNLHILQLGEKHAHDI